MLPSPVSVTKVDQNSAEFILDVISHALKTLSLEQDLSPRNQIINDLLSRLVDVLSQHYPLAVEAAVLGNTWLRKNHSILHDKLSQAEGAMEVYWVNKLNETAVITQKDLECFWYWQSYVCLVRLELAQLKSLTAPVKMGLSGGLSSSRTSNGKGSVCFVGSGPLPLTAIILHQSLRQPVTCVDICPEACKLSRTFLKKAGYGSKITVHCADGGSSYDYGLHSIIFIAALIPDKDKVLRRIGSTARNNPVIAIRSAERLQSVLYQPLEELMKEIPAEGPIARTKWHPGVINITIFYQASDSWRERMATI